MSDLIWIDKDLGPVDAYALAVAGGYVGTKEQWIAEIANASTNASNTEAYATGTRGGEDVDTDDPAYHNNGKYYNDQAALNKAAAQAAAETASAAYNVNLLASNYDATSKYDLGTPVIYDGGYHKCIVPITTPEAWTAEHWKEVAVGDEVAALEGHVNANDYYLEKKIVKNENDIASHESRIKDAEDKLNYTHELKTINIVNKWGDRLVDNNDRALTGQITLIIFDDTLASDGYPASANAVGKIKSELVSEKMLREANCYYLGNIVNRNSATLSEIEDKVNERALSFEYKNVPITNDSGDKIIDNEYKILTGKRLLPITDSTGSMEGVPMDAGMVGHTFKMEYEKLPIPVMYLTHPNLPELKSKEDGDLKNVYCSFPYRKFTNVKLKKLKIQGATSTAYPKKNYTITFNDNVCLNDSWGYHKKYVLKADYVDFSHMRNEIGAKIWGQIRKTYINPKNARLADEDGNHLIDGSSNTLAGENRPQYAMGMNYGAIDAYPILLVINDTYWGIYSVSIPKDDWMAGFVGDNEHEAIVSAEQADSATYFNHEVTSINSDMEMYNGSVHVFDVEYLPDEDDYTWIKDSINTLIDAAMESHGGEGHEQEYIDGISPYVDIDSAIDYCIFSCLVDNWDGTGRNYLLDTWDGVKWYFMVYDMDNIFGFDFRPSTPDYFRNPADGLTFAYFARISRIMHIIYSYDKAALKSRYAELRETVMSDANITTLVMNYASHIPEVALHYENLRWPERFAANVNRWDQLIHWFRLRCHYMDAEIEAM